MLLFPHCFDSWLLTLPCFADSSWFPRVCSCLRARVRISSSTPELFKASPALLRGSEGSKEADVPPRAVRRQQFSAQTRISTAASAPCAAVLQNEPVPPRARNPSLTSAARWERQPRVSSSCVTNIRVLICVPSKHRTPAQPQLSHHKLV